MPYDASNRKDIRRAEKEARQAEIRALDYLIGAMSIPQGRAWFYELLEQCYCFNEPETWDPYQNMYYKGVRNVGLRIFADISTHCPNDYITMVKEANARRIERDIRDARASADHASTAEYPGGEDGGRDLEGPVDSPTVDDIYDGPVN